MEIPKSADTPATGGEQVRRVRISVRGAVQGVGFRPFVFRLAHELGVRGYVRNTPEGVLIEAESAAELLEQFVERIETDKPPLSIVEHVATQWRSPVGDASFEIVASKASGESSALVLPDVATCPACLNEMRDPANRRHGYPFTNCTHCGPRYSIIHRLPYDRPNTSMSEFTMCEACRAEYEDPADRRFHAQPIACPECGPHLELWTPQAEVIADRGAALDGAAEALRAGRILALKGLGGYQLLADARDEAAVRELRRRKHREEKPFALMYPDLDAVQADCQVSELEARLLRSPESPIVLLHRREGGMGYIAPAVAPGNPTLGVMLPYTPLHHLLLEALGFPVVATSGNLSEEPICIDDADALERLGGIADLFLLHNRPIVRHVDDSIVRVVMGEEMVLRRARGYAPLPLVVDTAPHPHAGRTTQRRKGPAAHSDAPPVLAVGGHLKNTVAVSKGRHVFISQHIGDLETPRAFDAFAHTVSSVEDLYRTSPARVVCDMHPDYLSTKYARQLGLPVVAVQHHYAHVLSCMAEHSLDGPVLGVSWDGSGYGPDGTVWGGEFLAATFERFDRVAHLRPFRLPGGERAVREGRRAALGILYEIYGENLPDSCRPWLESAFDAAELKNLFAMLRRGLNTPQTTSAGRLFDAAASLCGLRHAASFEGQAAMALEHAARRTEGGGSDGQALLPLVRCGGSWVLDWAPLIESTLEAVQAEHSPGDIAYRLHRALAAAIADAAEKAGLHDVALTGGCFQNTLLTELASGHLEARGYRVHRHRRVPPNDGGIALGQAAYALRQPCCRLATGGVSCV